MVNVGYHSARLQAKLIRSLYTRRITQIVRTPIAQTQRVPITVYAFSCERDLPEQVASLRSFLRYVGIPMIMLLSIRWGKNCQDYCQFPLRM